MIVRLQTVALLVQVIIPPKVIFHVSGKKKHPHVKLCDVVVVFTAMAESKL